MKTAVLHIPQSDCEPAMAEMLQAAGYAPLGIGRDLARLINKAGVRPGVASTLKPQAGMNELRRCDLFVTVKHYNLPLLEGAFPFLKGKILWFDINGGEPGVYIDAAPQKTYPWTVPVPYVSANKRYAEGTKTNGPRYVCWPPLVESEKERHLNLAHRREVTGSPICLVHNVYYWGYGWAVDDLRERVGLKAYGSHGSPDGLRPPGEVPDMLRTTVCYVHLKSHDCPGYSLYRALLAACPIVLTRQFVEFTGFTDLYVDGETCLMVDDDADLKFPARSNLLVNRFVAAIDRLRKDQDLAKHVAGQGRRRLVDLMWHPDRDGPGFKKFLQANFG